MKPTERQSSRHLRWKLWNRRTYSPYATGETSKSILFFPKHERCGCRQKGTSGRCSKKSILTNPQNRLYHQHGWRPQQRAFDEFGLSNDIQCGEHQLYGNYQRSDGGVRLFKRKQREISFLHLQFLSSRQSFLQHLFLYESGIVNFVQAIAQEWEPFGIAVNCINPERTKTPMRVKNFGTEPENTLLSAEKVAIATIQSLVSEFTGQVIDVKRNEV